MEKDKAKRSASQVDGFLSDKEGELLYNFAKKCTEKSAIVEIGSWKGKSTIWLGNGSKNGNRAKVYAIDPHVVSHAHKFYGNLKPFEEFTRNIKEAEIEDTVVPIVQTSKMASISFHNDVGFLFIDGDHEYEAVKQDFQVWFPKLLNGGFIAFHDTVGSIKYPGPMQVVKEFLYSTCNFRKIGFIDSITFGQKVRKTSIKDKFENKYVLLLSDHPMLRVMHRFLPKILRDRVTINYLSNSIQT